MSLPIFARARECSVIGEDWEAVLDFRRDDLEALWSSAVDRLGLETLRSINASLPAELAWEVYYSRDQLSLWLGDQRLSVIRREEPVE